MCQKILAGHESGANAATGLIEVRVDQVALGLEPNRILEAAVDAGLTKSNVEVTVAYPSHCFNTRASSSGQSSHYKITPEAANWGLLVAQPGAGFASTIHFERFACPFRLLLTDDPRLANSGAVGMLTLPASRSQLCEALLSGKTSIRPAVSVQVLLSGRIRPFVSARDVTLEMLRLGIEERIKAVFAKSEAPVVLEFGGPSCKFLSMGDRAILAAIAPQLGAAAALFESDDKTDTFLRNQRRSKAHRTLTADPGAPWEDVISIDLASVSPLVMDEHQKVRPVRELEGRAIDQVLLGGDSGVSLRDFLAVAALLKSKRVATGVDFLLCTPDRQTLEVLTSGPLADLVATGARVLEPDARVLTGEFYAPSADDRALKTCDHHGQPWGMIASAETLALAVATGEIGDPRHFKRPVRISVPRTLPTDDVLILRGGPRGRGRASERPAPLSTRLPWNGSIDLTVTLKRGDLSGPSVFVAESLEDIRWISESATAPPQLRAVIAQHIPAATASVLADMGVLALRANKETIKRVGAAHCVHVPEQPASGGERISIHLDDETDSLDFLDFEPVHK